MNLSRSESFLFGPPGTGWQHQGKINLAIRTYGERTLMDMRDILRQMEVVMNGRCKQWKVLDCMRRNLEIYCHEKVERELRIKERKYFECEPREEVRRGMIPVILELESLGIVPFMDYIYETFYALNKIFNREITRICDVIDNTGLKFEDLVTDLVDNAYEIIDKYQTYISLKAAGSGLVNWREFWELFKTSHTKIRQLAHIVGATKSPDALEQFLGLTLLDYGIYIPAVKRPQVPIVRPTITSTREPTSTIAGSGLGTTGISQKLTPSSVSATVKRTPPSVSATVKRTPPTVSATVKRTPPSVSTTVKRTPPASISSSHRQPTPPSVPSSRSRQPTPPSILSSRKQTPTPPSSRQAISQPGVPSSRRLSTPPAPRPTATFAVTRGRGLGPSGIKQKLAPAAPPSHRQPLPHEGPARRLSLPPESRRRTSSPRSKLVNVTQPSRFARQ